MQPIHITFSLRCKTFSFLSFFFLFSFCCLLRMIRFLTINNYTEDTLASKSDHPIHFCPICCCLHLFVGLFAHLPASLPACLSLSCCLYLISFFSLSVLHCPASVHSFNICRGRHLSLNLLPLHNKVQSVSHQSANSDLFFLLGGVGWGVKGMSLKKKIFS